MAIDSKKKTQLLVQLRVLRGFSKQVILDELNIKDTVYNESLSNFSRTTLMELKELYPNDITDTMITLMIEVNYNISDYLRKYNNLQNYYMDKDINTEQTKIDIQAIVDTYKNKVRNLYKYERDDKVIVLALLGVSSKTIQEELGIGQTTYNKILPKLNKYLLEELCVKYPSILNDTIKEIIRDKEYKLNQNYTQTYLEKQKIKNRKTYEKNIIKQVADKFAMYEVNINQQKRGIYEEDCLAGGHKIIAESKLMSYLKENDILLLKYERRLTYININTRESIYELLTRHIPLAKDNRCHICMVYPNGIFKVFNLRLLESCLIRYMNNELNFKPLTKEQLENNQLTNLFDWYNLYEDIYRTIKKETKIKRDSQISEAKKNKYTVILRDSIEKIENAYIKELVIAVYVNNINLKQLTNKYNRTMWELLNDLQIGLTEISKMEEFNKIPSEY